MNDTLAKVKDGVTGVTDIVMHLVALAILVEVVYGTGIFGMGIIKNVMEIINALGASGFAGLVSLLVLVGLFRTRSKAE